MGWRPPFSQYFGIVDCLNVQYLSFSVWLFHDFALLRSCSLYQFLRDRATLLLSYLLSFPRWSHSFNVSILAHAFELQKARRSVCVVNCLLHVDYKRLSTFRGIIAMFLSLKKADCPDRRTDYLHYWVDDLSVLQG